MIVEGVKVLKSHFSVESYFTSFDPWRKLLDIKISSKKPSIFVHITRLITCVSASFAHITTLMTCLSVSFAHIK